MENEKNPTMFIDSKNRVVYIKSEDGTHHVTNNKLKLYLNCRKEIPKLCIIYTNFAEMQKKLELLKILI